MIKIKTVVWDKWNIEHIKKHKVTRKEVEEICQGVYKQQPTYNNRFLIFGKTRSNRSLTVAVSRKKPGVYYLVTARDTSKKERREFINENGKNS